MAEKLKGETEVNVSVLAAAVLEQKEEGSSKVLHELLLDMLKDQQEKRQKEKAKLERLALSSVAAAKEAAEMDKRQKANCSHRKQDGSTRLSGQRLSNGQVSLVCKFCGDEFFDPPFAYQKAIPMALAPPSDEVGG